MLTRFPKLFSFIAISILLTNCSKEDSKYGHYQINFTPYFGNQELKFDTKYPFQIGNTTYQFKIDVLKIYFSDIDVSFDSTSSVKNLHRDVELYNIKNYVGKSNFTLTLEDSMLVGNYSKAKMNFNIGLNESKNSSDPNSYDSNHPLSTASGMYWGMIKYRFVVFEGVIYDSNGTELNGISYHTGIDLMQLLSKNINLNITENNTSKINIHFDLSKIFTNVDSPINPTIETFTHSSPGIQYDLAKKVTNNLSKGIIVNVE